MAGKATAEIPSASAQEVARIREIILGPHLRDYEQRFQLIQRDLDRLQSLISQLADQVHEQGVAQTDALQSEAARLSTQLADQDNRQTQRLHEESSKLDTAIAGLRAQVAEQDNRQSQRLQDESSRIASAHAALRAQLELQDKNHNQRLKQEVDRLDKQLALAENSAAKKLQALQREARQANDELRNEVRLMIDKLTRDKTDRQSLGQMLVEIGNQLTRSNEVVSLEELLSGLSAEPLPEPKQESN